MSLSRTLAEYISACFTGLWIQSHEHQDALADLRPPGMEHELAEDHSPAARVRGTTLVTHGFRNNAKWVGGERRDT